MVNKIDVPSRWTNETGEAVAKQNELAADVYSTGQSIEEMRAGYRTERAYWNEGGPVMAATVDGVIPTDHGDIAVRMYRPTTDAVLPVIFFTHGGGWCLGDLDTHDRMTRILAEESGAAVIAIDYGLSPETKYPTNLQQCVAVVQAVRAAAGEWGIDGDDVSFAGDSGGAHIALASYLYLREVEKAADNVRALLLFYGWFGLRDSPSQRRLGGPWDGITQDELAFYIGQALADERQIEDRFLDLFRNDLTRDMPATYIVAAELDPLLDDSRLLADILESSGIPVKLDIYEGIIHAFLHHSRLVPEAGAALAAASEFYRAQASQS
ncbi:acetyl esterase [Flaviflexus huanghaiensis]|uniref:acetyl esterase n=1 Tax=Flaviflexus huanghaiensis TaxID=1111473 RepID=UPI0015F793D3